MAGMSASNVDVEVTSDVSVGNYYDRVIEKYGIPFGHYCIKSLYSVYINFTVSDAVIFFIKSIPMFIYMFKFVKSTYTVSRERLKVNQSQLEDLQLQLQIVKAKISCHESEFPERENHLRRTAEQLRRIRAQVRQLISEDHELVQAINQGAPWTNEFQLSVDNTPDEEYKLIEELLKGLKYEQLATPELQKEKSKTCRSESGSLENSDYSSANGTDGNQDCHVKIVKVTNVYRVAFLKQFIKHKRLWRANKRAMLKKKINNIKKLLGNWQKTLHAVINDKVELLNMNSQPFGITSEEAMGDCSRCNLSDTDADYMHSAESYFEDYTSSWQNQYAYPNYMYDDSNTLDTELTQDNDDRCQCQISLIKGSNLSILPEETSSQMEIEEIRQEKNY